MRITILPLGLYANKAYYKLIEDVDHCVLITDGYYAKRRVNRAMLPDGKWITIPVCKDKRQRVSLAHAKIWWAKDEWHRDMVQRVGCIYGSEYLESNDVYKDIKSLPEFGGELLYTLKRTTLGVLKYLNIHTPLSNAIDHSGNNFDGQTRAIRVCKALEATEYVQPNWTTRFFDPVAFARHGIDLKFYEPEARDDLEESILDSCFTWWQ